MRSGAASIDDLAPGLPFDFATPYALAAQAKRRTLLDTLNALSAWHSQRCEPYRQMASRLFTSGPATCLEDLPYVPVRLFKMLDLCSVPREQVVRTLTSSGTSGQAVSRIALDRETSMRQTRALVAIVTSFVGQRRLPMAIVDAQETVKGRSTFSARAAGVIGFSTFGRDHFYCLDEHLRLRADSLDAFLAAHAGGPFLLFGFTFVVWQGLYEGARAAGRRFDFGPGSTLIHGGGWKRLADQAVTNERFKGALREQLGIERIFNYYGMVEQVGSIFMECEQGHLHCPDFAHVLVRDPTTLLPVPVGAPGVLQVLSALPLSYPGHSLLTEDLGVLHGEDDCACGRKGRHFSVLGRLPQSELRGCSDTRTLP